MTPLSICSPKLYAAKIAFVNRLISFNLSELIVVSLLSSKEYFTRTSFGLCLRVLQRFHPYIAINSSAIASPRCVY